MKAREVLGPLSLLGGLLIAAVLLHVLSRWTELRIAQMEAWPSVVATVREIRPRAVSTGKWGTEPEYELKLTTVFENKTYWHTKLVDHMRNRTFWTGIGEGSQFTVLSNPADPTNILLEVESRSFLRRVRAIAWLVSAAFLFAVFRFVRKGRFKSSS